MLIYASFLIGAAAIFDFLDGFAARLLKVHSEIGKQLDSLADMVTFGVLPGMILFNLIQPTLRANELPSQLAFITFLIPVFSALRLAKFNIDTRQSDSFIGVPTPANSILIGSLPLILKYNPSFECLILNPYFLIITTIIMSYLLVAELPLFALKFKNFTWADNKIRYIFLVLSLILLFAFQFTGIPFTILLYIVLSVINNLQKRKNA